MSRPLSSTVDAGEKAQFEKYASLWWNLEGPFWPLHRMNQLRTGFILDLVREQFGLQDVPNHLPLNGIRFLDIGCGGGILSEAIARLGGEVLGIDMLEKNVGIARTHAEISGLSIQYRCATVEELCLEDHAFDVVLNMEVVEHVLNPELFLQSASKLVRPGGMMFVATLNRTWLSYLSAILAAERILKILPKGTHQWAKFQRPGDILSILGACGLLPVRVTGVWMNPLKRSFRLVPFTVVNFMIAFTKQNG